MTGHIGCGDRSASPRVTRTRPFFQLTRLRPCVLLPGTGGSSASGHRERPPRARPWRRTSGSRMAPLAEPPVKCRLSAVDYAGCRPQSTWLERARPTNEDQAAVGTTSAGPVLSLESRMPTWSVHFAISTHAPPVSLLYEDLNQADSSATSRAVILVMMAMPTLVLVLPGTRPCEPGAGRCRAWRRSGGCAFELPAARR